MLHIECVDCKIDKLTDMKNVKSDYTILAILVIAVIFIYVLSWIYVDCAYVEGEDRGAFGDKFGDVNALLSGLAFAGLIYYKLYYSQGSGCKTLRALLLLHI